MPLSMLLCEGDEGSTDAIVLRALLDAGGVNVEVVPSHNKERLGAMVVAPRRPHRGDVKAVRDRDFEFDPTPEKAPVPWHWDKQEVGWRWGRHELESYLVDPVLAVPALSRPHPAIADAFEDILKSAANSLVAYAAARWTAGVCARGHVRLTTGWVKDWHLPALDETACRTWVATHIQGQRGRLPDEATCAAKFDDYLARFRDADLEASLLWYPGKDLFAAVAAEARGRSFGTPSAKELCKDVRDWVRNNAERALDLVPEWSAFVSLVAA